MDIYCSHVVLCVLITIVGRSCGQTDPFSVKPINTYGILGRNTILQCGTNDGSQFFWRRPNGETIADSTSGVYPQFVNKYTLTNVGNTYTLNILNLDQATDDGQYECNSQRHSSSAFAEVIILGSDQLECIETSESGDYGDTLEGETIKLECQISYYGLWAPIQDWVWSDMQMIDASNLTYDTLVAYEYQYTVDRTDNNKYWIVTAQFPAPYDGMIPDDVTDVAPTEFYSRETPNFESTYDSTVLCVLHGPDTMSLDPVQEEYNPGDTINCAAQGNPEPDLKWLDAANNTIVESGTLLIEPWMEGRQTYSCVATNVVRGETMTSMETITFNVTNTLTPEECCFLEQWEGDTLIYYGFVTPDTEPTAYDGQIRIAYDYVNQKTYTHYVDLEQPPEPDLVAIIGDYEPTPKKFYNIFKNETCYIDEYNTFMTPRCISDIWPKLMEFTLAMDIPAAMYGDVVNHNFVTVRRSDCLPMVNLATRPNIPTPGTFRFETTQYANITEGISDPSIFTPPDNCVPRP